MRSIITSLRFFGALFEGSLACDSLTAEANLPLKKSRKDSTKVELQHCKRSSQASHYRMKFSGIDHLNLLS